MSQSEVNFSIIASDLIPLFEKIKDIMGTAAYDYYPRSFIADFFTFIKRSLWDTSDKKEKVELEISYRIALRTIDLHHYLLFSIIDLLDVISKEDIKIPEDKARDFISWFKLGFCLVVRM